LETEFIGNTTGLSNTKIL